MTRWARRSLQQKNEHSGTEWKDLKKTDETNNDNGDKADSSTTKPSIKDRLTQLSAAHSLAIKKDKRSENRRIKRIRKKESSRVCFHCRVSGHGMADCPMLKDDVEQGTDICFKCGSTEHSSTVCSAKLPPGKEFMFAKCFVCGEAGHLSKSCPDNPRGVYPEGGCCRLCGSVEHFRKDCPDRDIKKEVTVYRMTPSSGLHVSMDDDLSLYEDVETKVKPKITKPKIVKF